MDKTYQKLIDKTRGDMYWAKQVEYHLIGADGAKTYTYYMLRMNQAIETCNKIENTGMRNGYMYTIKK